MGLGWDSNGMGLKWNELEWNETRMEWDMNGMGLEWDPNGTQMGLKRDSKGTQMELK